MVIAKPEIAADVQKRVWLHQEAKQKNTFLLQIRRFTFQCAHKPRLIGDTKTRLVLVRIRREFSRQNPPWRKNDNLRWCSRGVQAVRDRAKNIAELVFLSLLTHEMNFSVLRLS